MHTRNQNRAPTIQGNKVSQSLSNKNELLHEEQFDKRRKIGGGTMAGTRSRPPLSAVNALPGSSGTVPASERSNGDNAGGQLEFKSREDVEKLLAEKLNPKNRNNDKGRIMELRDSIKKFRTCINWYMELEDGYLAELEKLRGMLESEQRRHCDIEAQMNCKIDELNLLIEEHQKHVVSLEESLRKAKADKLAAIESYEKEAEAKAASEKLRCGLLEELEKTTEGIKYLNDQIKMIQETNKRLQEYNTSLQQYNNNLQAEAMKNGDTVTKLQKDKTAMMETLAGLRDQSSLLKNQLDAIRSSQQEALKQREEYKKEVDCLRGELQQVRVDRDHQLEHIQLMNVELKKYEEVNGKSSRDKDIALTKAHALEETCSLQQDQIKSLHYQLTIATEKLKKADLTTIEIKQENEAKNKLVDGLQSRVTDLECQLVEGEKLRKKLHNTILELKGNIRVFCRVRPTLPTIDCSGDDGTVVSYPPGVEYLGRGIDLTHNGQSYSFAFDQVFSHESSQADVFYEISQLVQSALDGYKVCIFAYGQTGSGKTYTMMGRPESEEQKGLIPRSLEQIFETSQSLKYQGWKYKMQASMLEIYNETIRDLLSPSRCNNIDTTHANKLYTIKHDSAGNTFVSDLTVVDVCSINEVSFLLNQAAQSRSVGKTQMNEQSSRSHFVFTLRISGFNDSTEQQVQGVLNLIDLAGSERLAKSGSTGDRLKETQAINKSLSSLSDVIFAIAKKDDHVPYRNSKLTYLLQPCLGGDSKTLMFVNISPEASSAGESICSLRFAARVNSCEIGVPRRHTQMRPLDSRLSYG
ncbi:kinesin-like protein KIN-14H [Phalaenopsis equestris]|uniref:kinesin-like protein KIN-14H n=1 Tax=Phalaenopsis equestris TaxID=78828 RepID=UPI0009E4E417|nr:kinesin-like protein KIN-14H [Phalaenopsis equestris]